MGQERYRALVVDQAGDGVTAAFRDLARDEFPPGEVTVRVAYSGLNYKDGLAVAGRPGVIRAYPMVPGIDLAGTVEESAAPCGGYFARLCRFLALRKPYGNRKGVGEESSQHNP